MKIKTITKTALFVLGIGVIVAFGEKGLTQSNVTYYWPW
jgi:hypothetical protein